MVYAVAFSPSLSNILDTGRGNNKAEMHKGVDYLDLMFRARQAISKNMPNSIASMTGGDTRGCLLLRVTCLVCLLGMALVAITAQGQTFAYVANAHPNSVSVIDTASNKVVGTVAVGAYPWGLAITPDGSRAYVADTDSGSVSVIDKRRKKLIAQWRLAITPLASLRKDVALT